MSRAAAVEVDRIGTAKHHRHDDQRQTTEHKEGDVNQPRARSEDRKGDHAEHPGGGEHDQTDEESDERGRVGCVNGRQSVPCETGDHHADADVADGDRSKYADPAHHLSHDAAPSTLVSAS